MNTLDFQLTAPPRAKVKPRTKRRKDRNDYDAYYTGDRPAVEAMILECSRFLRPDSTVLEVCCGNGDIAQPLKDHKLSVMTNDINPGVIADFHLDATDDRSYREFPEVDYIISNPPFLNAAQILPRCYEKARVGIIMLLRLSWQEYCGNRAHWHRTVSDKQSIIYPDHRISFTGDGNTDLVATAWFVWGKEERLLRPFVYPDDGQISIPF